MIRLIVVVLFLLPGCVSQMASYTPDQILRARALVDSGTHSLRSKNLEQARASFEVAFELAALPEALEGIACVYMLQQEYKSAEKLLFIIRDSYPEYSHVEGNIALLYQLADQPDLAQKWYERAVKSQSDNFRFRNNFAVLLHEKGMRSGARRELQRAAATSQHSNIEENLLKTYTQEKSNEHR